MNHKPSIVRYGVKEVASSWLGDEQKLDIKAIYKGVCPKQYKTHTERKL